MAVMGVTGSGKSTFIQHFSSREVVVGESLVSSTLTESPELAIWREILTTIYSDSES
jgi:KaiC/GvpD/RAD55 family RecA-like ATPase